jgi:RNA polymerase sigma-70 factor (ECF subfamily)
MEAYQQADERAAAELVRRVGPSLYRSLLAHVRDTSIAEDLLQDTWIRVHKARHTYRPPSPVLPWLYAIAEHTRLDGFRRRQRRQGRECAIDSVAEPAMERPDDIDQRLTLEKLLQALPENQREVLVMLKVSGLSLEEIAQIKGASVGAIKLRAHRGYNALRALLTPAESGGKARAQEGGAA